MRRIERATDVIKFESNRSFIASVVFYRIIRFVFKNLIAYVWLQEPERSIWGSEVSAPLFSEVVEMVAPYLRLPDDRTRACLYTDVCPTEEPEEDDYYYYYW